MYWTEGSLREARAMYSIGAEMTDLELVEFLQQKAIEEEEKGEYDPEDPYLYFKIFKKVDRAEGAKFNKLPKDVRRNLVETSLQRPARSHEPDDDNDYDDDDDDDDDVSGLTAEEAEEYFTSYDNYCNISELTELTEAEIKAIKTKGKAKADNGASSSTVSTSQPEPEPPGNSLSLSLDSSIHD